MYTHTCNYHITANVWQKLTTIGRDGLIGYGPKTYLTTITKPVSKPQQYCSYLFVHPDTALFMLYQLTKQVYRNKCLGMNKSVQKKHAHNK